MTDLQYSFTVVFSSEFAMKGYITQLSRSKSDFTVECQTLMFKNSRFYCMLNSTLHVFSVLCIIVQYRQNLIELFIRKFMILISDQWYIKSLFRNKCWCNPSDLMIDWYMAVDAANNEWWFWHRVVQMAQNSYNCKKRL